MTHRATLRHTPGLMVVFGLLAFLLVFVPAMAGSYTAAAASFLLVAATGWRFNGMRLVLDDQGLCFRGWVGNARLPYSSIGSIERPYEKGWPYDRLYGPWVYRIKSGDTQLTVNFLWFGPAACRDFRKHLAAIKPEMLSDVHRRPARRQGRE